MIQSNYYPNLIVFSNVFILCVESPSVKTHGKDSGGDSWGQESKKEKKKQRSKRKERFKMKDEKREKRPIRKVIELEAK